MNTIIHSAAYAFARWLFIRAVKRALALGALLFLVTLVLLYGSISAATCTMAYEALIQQAGVPILLRIAFCAGLLLSAVSIYTDNYAQGGKYMIMTFPFPRRQVFFAYCGACLLTLLTFWLVQLLTLTALYELVVRQCQAVATEFAANNGTLAPTVARTNGLFLAFLRSGVLRLLLPPTLLEAGHSFLLLLGMSIFPAYALLGELKGISCCLAAAPFSVMLYALNTRLFPTGTGMQQSSFFYSALLLLLALGYMVYITVKRLNQSANAI